MSLLSRLFPPRHTRIYRKLARRSKQVAEHRERVVKLSDEELSQQFLALRERLDNGEKLDEMMVEAFAFASVAADRALGLRPFDCQIVGGMTLHAGTIAEMATGEGKTLVATLAASLNALAGSVHLVTVNDYLARRDCEWMGPMYRLLGLTVGLVVHETPPDQRREQYECDVVYVTNTELGFDFLRDNMALHKSQVVQGDFNFAIIDEVDSILIDEARTPLIISGAAEDRSQLYKQLRDIVANFVPQAREETDEEPLEEHEHGDYLVDEKARQVELTDRGHLAIEERLRRLGILREGDTLYSPEYIEVLNAAHAMLRAEKLFKRDVDYLVEDNQVVLIDEHTGRALPGRRLSQGNHQALEVKEGVKVQAESQTLASITYQNLFRMFDKLSGMTGTALTEAEEFREIYGLEVVPIPTNLPVARVDYDDLVYTSRDGKLRAVVGLVHERVGAGAPCLIGTASVEASEHLSRLLKKAGIKHQVLNARRHAYEAQIIAEAGKSGAVTIATNMAGRGTDIVLGGKPPEDADNEALEKHALDREKVLEAGGLHVIATERHESRRIDNQLRGRSGRQGDPGVSQFFLSLEDDLMRVFAAEWVQSLIQSLNVGQDEPIEARMLTKSIANAQRRVETRNFDVRKQLLEYDDIANEQRSFLYEERNGFLLAEGVGDRIDAMIEDVMATMVTDSIGDGVDVARSARNLKTTLQHEFGIDLPVEEWVSDSDNEEEVIDLLTDHALEQHNGRRTEVGSAFGDLERGLALQVLDRHWKIHLGDLDHLRGGIHLRAYAQRNPRQEYKREAYEMFERMLDAIRSELVRILMRVRIDGDNSSARADKARVKAERVKAAHGAMVQPKRTNAQVEQVTAAPKVGRNDPCPCGSGKKYKKCCGLK